MNTALKFIVSLFLFLNFLLFSASNFYIRVEENKHPRTYNHTGVAELLHYLEDKVYLKTVGGINDTGNLIIMPYLELNKNDNEKIYFHKESSKGNPDNTFILFELEFLYGTKRHGFLESIPINDVERFDFFYLTEYNKKFDELKSELNTKKKSAKIFFDLEDYFQADNSYFSTGKDYIDKVKVVVNNEVCNAYSVDFTIITKEYKSEDYEINKKKIENYNNETFNISNKIRVIIDKDDCGSKADEGKFQSNIATCKDDKACNFGYICPYLQKDCCEYPEKNYDCDGKCLLAVDCADECGGDAVVDECGKCEGSGILDCAGECDGKATLDKCGVCNGDNSTCVDCNGKINGTAKEDKCGICDSNPKNDCVQDCNNNWGGEAKKDKCGVCDANPANDCVQDCTGKWGGNAVVDECGVCDGLGSVYACGCKPIDIGKCDCDGNMNDCAGNCAGLAELDECGICDDDSSNDNLTCTGCMYKRSKNLNKSNDTDDCYDVNKQSINCTISCDDCCQFYNENLFYISSGFSMLSEDNKYASKIRRMLMKKIDDTKSKDDIYKITFCTNKENCEVFMNYSNKYNFENQNFNKAFNKVMSLPRASADVQNIQEILTEIKSDINKNYKDIDKKPSIYLFFATERTHAGYKKNKIKKIQNAMKEIYDYINLHADFHMFYFYKNEFDKNEDFSRLINNFEFMEINFDKDKYTKLLDYFDIE